MRDLGSRYGSFVDGHYASESPLRPGDICQTSGLYLSSGACGDTGYQRVTEGQPFPTCTACGKAVTWTFRETYAPILFGNQKNQEART